MQNFSVLIHDIKRFALVANYPHVKGIEYLSFACLARLKAGVDASLGEIAHSCVVFSLHYRRWYTHVR